MARLACFHYWLPALNLTRIFRSCWPERLLQSEANGYLKTGAQIGFRANNLSLNNLYH